MKAIKSKTPYRGTEVPVGRSQEFITKLLRKHDVGATRFTSAGLHVGIEFIRHEQPYKITATSLGLDDKSERQIWRILFFWLKAKLTVLDFNIGEFETEFLPYALITHDGKSATVDEAIRPRLLENK